MADDHLAAAFDEVFRREHRRVVATVARTTGDLDLAEDAVAEAFGVAAARWRREGVPDNPGAWLTTVARNRAVDVLRREGRRPERERSAAGHRASVAPAPDEPDSVGDDDLALLFLTCHPALPVESRVALSLQVVFGLSTAEIARLLLQGEEAVAKRLQRARRKIRDARIPVRLPPPARRGERVPAVVDVLYLVFTEGYAPSTGDAVLRDDLCREAIRLTRLLVDLAPDEPSPRALLALQCLQHSRAAARTDEHGELVVLELQDRRRWDRTAIEEGVAQLGLAAARRPLPPAAEALVLQATIAAAHATAPTWDDTDWSAIVDAYDALVILTGSPVAALNRAVAVSFVDGPVRALALLDEVDADPRLAGSHQRWVVRAELLQRAGDADGAAAAYRTALDLAGTEAERSHLRRRLAALTAPG